jgi:hypothetical protein
MSKTSDASHRSDQKSRLILASGVGRNLTIKAKYGIDNQKESIA